MSKENAFKKLDEIWKRNNGMRQGRVKIISFPNFRTPQKDKPKIKRSN